MQTPPSRSIVQAEPEPSGLQAVTSGEVLSQLQAAHAYPRNVDLFRRNAMAWACVDEETAASCFYAVPRDGKTIEGPSIRMAEIAAIAWGNLRVRTRLTARDARTVTVEAEVWDLETNAAFAASETGRITKRDGSTYSEDMVQTAIRATAAKARRNAILAVIPGAFLKPVLQKARETAVGNASTLSNNRAKALEALQKMGVTPARVLAKLGKASIQLIDLDDLLLLRSDWTAIKEGDVTVDEAFPEPQAPAPAKVAPQDPFLAGKPATAVPEVIPPQPAAPAQAEPAKAATVTGPAQGEDPVRSDLVARWSRLLMAHAEVVDRVVGDPAKRPITDVSTEELSRWVDSVEAFAPKTGPRRRPAQDRPQA